jgi:hypothetical protein
MDGQWSIQRLGNGAGVKWRNKVACMCGIKECVLELCRRVLKFYRCFSYKKKFTSVLK